MRKFCRDLLLLGTTGWLALAMPMSATAEDLTDGLDSVSLAEIRQELNSAPADIRARMSKEQMGRFVTNMLMDRRLAVAAKQAGTAETEAVKAQIAKATREIVVRAYMDAELAKLAEKLPNIDALAKERYDVDKATYIRPEAVRVAHILFRVLPENPELTDEKVKVKAEKVLAELKNGGDFAALAKANSDDRGTSGRGGELPGWSDKGKLVPQFEEAAYKLKPGEISGLVRTRFGYHIIKLLAHRDAADIPFEDVKGQIVSKLRKDMMAQKQQDFLKPFTGTKPIQIDDATLEALRKD